ncbi:hypothetical protein [Streptomyces sp. NPDC002187]|uniref:hypothetical protein n=1 Tax=Streptomyces sp. NPDC002187 TaxID=3364637 RepID=UPI0036C119CA
MLLPHLDEQQQRLLMAADWHAATQRNLFNRMLGQLYHCLQHARHYDEAVAFPGPAPAVAHVA